MYVLFFVIFASRVTLGWLIETPKFTAFWILHVLGLRADTSMACVCSSLTYFMQVLCLVCCPKGHFDVS